VSSGGHFEGTDCADLEVASCTLSLPACLQNVICYMPQVICTWVERTLKRTQYGTCNRSLLESHSTTELPSHVGIL
jgi:hypothetical protein